jgi:hypothetical protein
MKHIKTFESFLGESNKKVGLNELIDKIKKKGGKEYNGSGGRKWSGDYLFKMPNGEICGIKRDDSDLILTLDIDSNGEGYNHWSSEENLLDLIE